MTRCKRLLIALPGAGARSACGVREVVNPATGKTEFTAMSPDQELEIGKEQHPQVLMQFGGAYEDPELQAYVTRVGERLTAVSELPGWISRFTVLNSDVINAFALPGGYVYLARGLLALADNEAEARGRDGARDRPCHRAPFGAALQPRRARPGGLAIGTILAAVLGGGAAADLVQQAGGVGAEAHLAGYSRDQEFQADELGVRYLARAGYDPTAMSTFLDKLERNDQLMRRLAGATARIPGQAGSRHIRARPIGCCARRAGKRGERGRRSHRPRRVPREIDGMIYGEDPSQGYVRGRTFVHPGLRFAFDVPQGLSDRQHARGGDRPGAEQPAEVRCGPRARERRRRHLHGPRLGPGARRRASATSRDRRWTACPWRARWPRVSSTTAARSPSCSRRLTRANEFTASCS